MKKILQYIMLASVFVACNSKSDLETKKDVILTDTSAMYRSNIMTDTGSVIQTTTLNRNNNPTVANRRDVYTNTNTGTSTPRTTRHSGYSSTANTSNSANTTTGRTVTRRRGWSHAAKDATIGGVGGAVLGAVISKNHVKGAVIGGVLGAGGGYILGRGKDKKEGRY